MRKAFLSLAALLVVAGCGTSEQHIYHHHDPIEIKPIHIRADVTIRAEDMRQLGEMPSTRPQ